MNKIICTIVCALGILATGCESEIEFQKESRLGLSLNSMLVPDTCIIAYITEFYSPGSIPNEGHFEEGVHIYWTSMFGKIYRVSRPPQTEPVVTFSVNGIDMGRLAMTTDIPGEFKSDYRPRAGDQVTIRAYDPSEPAMTVEASATMPPEIKFDLLSMRKAFRVKSAKDERDFYADSMARITIRINDRPDEKNYYRIKVREVYKGRTDVWMRQFLIDDIFECDDPIMSECPKGDDLQADGYTSTVFSDRTFDGSSKTLTLTKQLTRDRYNPFGENYKWLVVEVEEITEDLFKYIISTRNYNLSDLSVFSELVTVHSNTSTGVGIVGALSYDRRIIDPEQLESEE